MKRIFSGVQALLCALLLSGSVGANAQSSKSVAGPWNGILETPNPAQLIINISEPPNGPRIAALSVPQQKVTDMAFSGAEMQGDSLILLSDFLGLRYAAKLSADGQQLVGLWKQNGEKWNLTLTRGLPAPPPPPKRPQDPLAPLPYREQEVSFQNPRSGQQLAGTLTLPAGKGPFPAVVLVSGSGPQDRDEALMGHRPFLVLADYLTRRGVAVLRYDDRGVGKSGGTYATATTADFLTDAQAALQFLRTQPGIQPKRVGMLGHSEGGTIALLAGAQPAPPAFIVSLAGVGVSGTELLIRQQADLLRTAGLDTARLQQLRRTQQQVLQIITTTPDNPPAISKVVPLLKQASPGVTESALTAMASQMTAPWYRYFLTLNPQPELAKVKVPVLALNGSKDLQVAADLNLPAIEKGLKAGGNRDVTIQQLDGLNHLLQTATTGLPSEYGQLDETISPAALQLIGNWIASHTKR
ncbi:alpha/beta fold hydrolase [Microvirga sp. STR05]|uniref:Alpha/beta fold hydrolase n=1 Tax=Hymenobacter duratus TaxID=2771356 RepID=A0ABR8JDS2_9BACT|nr:alpha/beta fold hydrolase [Hymenobacter duratus]MBD2713915.1 alpha/beta fold hydrolase [Hymenobacter duratus]MBR7948817.1 alpha/beta fold hydrolase [Microvirga sp. STR05]